MKLYLKGLTPPRPQEARSGDRAAAVGDKVEEVAQAISSRSARAFEHSGGGSRDSGKGNGLPLPSNGDGLALGQVYGGGNGNGLALGHANLSNEVNKGKGKK